MTIATNTPKGLAESMPNAPTDGPTPRRTRPNPDKLPDNHLIDWLPQAKQQYETEPPPFVERNQGSNIAGLRKKVTLLVTHDQQQGLPVEAEIICWSWDSDWTFYTIDIGGRRLIIKGKSDDRYCHYQSWLGPKKGFSLQYVAYGPHQKDPEEPKLNLRTQLANKIRKISNTPPYLESSAKPDDRVQQSLIKAQYTPRPEWRSSGFSPINSPNSSSARPAYSDIGYPRRQQHAQGQQHHVCLESRPQAASPSVKGSPKPTETDSHDVQEIRAPIRRDSQHSAQAKKDRALSLGSRQDGSPPKGRDYSPNSPRDSVRVTPSQRPSNEAPEIKHDNPPTSTVHEDKAVETRRAHHTPAEPANERVTSKQPQADIADATPAHRPQHQGQNHADLNFLSKATKRKRQASTTNPTNPTSPQLSTSQSTRSSPQQLTTPSTSSQNPSRLSTPTTAITTTTTSLTTPQPTNHHHHHPSSSSSTSSSTPLTPHKQSHTTLFIAIPLSTDTVPLKLRSCTSLPSFFASVLAISGPASDQQDAVVSGIRATFRWKAEGDVDRAILLKREVPDTWEVFLEIVDAAPCWGREGEGRGRCGVGVEVVLV